MSDRGNRENRIYEINARDCHTRTFGTQFHVAGSSFSDVKSCMEGSKSVVSRLNKGIEL